MTAARGAAARQPTALGAALRLDRPKLPTRDDLVRTARTIRVAQHRSGAIPWDVVGKSAGKVDAWDHVESAMGLLVGGEVEAAERAYEWLAGEQRADGTWPIEWRLANETLRVLDAGVDANQCAYIAVGVWHHWLVRRDLAFVARMWPVVVAALDAVVELQLPSGAIAWSRGAGGTATTGLVAGSASIHHALRCGGLLAEVVGAPKPDWELAAARVAQALTDHLDGDPGDFEPKERYSMDWYYPVLGGAIHGERAERQIASRWDDFVVDGLGIRCVEDRPWVTGAETCELALALDSVGRRDEAVALVTGMQHLRDEDGSYHTGYVYADGLRWPIERSTWTAAAVLLAVDAVCGFTGGAGLFRN